MDAEHSMKELSKNSKNSHHPELAEPTRTVDVDYLAVEAIYELNKFSKEAKGIPELESWIKYIEDLIKDTYEAAQSCDLYVVLKGIEELSRAITLTEKEFVKHNINPIGLTIPLQHIEQDMYFIFKNMCKCQLKEKKLSLFEAAETVIL
jgi:hypothetical protein